MRKIKFRATDLNGVTRFGDFVQGKFICNTQGMFEIQPNTLAQLVGLDANGEEIYEGDVIVDQNEFEYWARLISTAVDTEFLSYDEISKNSPEYILKK